MRPFLYTGLFLSILFGFYNITNAQTLGLLATVEISLLPEYPQAGQVVQATVSSASESVRSSTIVWLLDEEIQQQESGGDTFIFTAGDVGSSKSLGVLVKTPDGQVLVKTIAIQPAETTLLWEAETYTPFFYRGRSLYSSGSTIRAEAFSNFVDLDGNQINSNELIYTWSKNGTVLGSLSGIGASTLITEGPKFFGTYILAVEVATKNGTQVARSAALVETQDPQIVLYENDPLIGVKFHSAIQKNYFSAGESQMTVQATPYFMDTTNVNSRELDYSWKVNGVEVFGEQESPSVLNIQLSSNEDIATRINIVINHARHLLQTGKGDFNITFEGNARNSLFGF